MGFAVHIYWETNHHQFWIYLVGTYLPLSTGRPSCHLAGLPLVWYKDAKPVSM
jgi:hypothetical protein